ncbi:MAG: hypothetical protein PWQ51_1882 [Methanolobus sp.]|jgi:hypothetical protein|nr:hypothetical protein [Methanolobus sp.]MDK2939717.1 hypothetical protein [Methanolobus sp.]
MLFIKIYIQLVGEVNLQSKNTNDNNRYKRYFYNKYESLYFTIPDPMGWNLSKVTRSLRIKIVSKFFRGFLA